MQINPGEQFKVPAGVSNDAMLRPGTVLFVRQISENGMVEVLSDTLVVFRVQQEIFEKLLRVIPINKGDKFRLPAKSIPDYLREKGLLPGSVVTAVDDFPGTRLVTVSTKHGISFSILADLLWEFDRVGKRAGKSGKSGKKQDAL